MDGLVGKLQRYDLKADKWYVDEVEIFAEVKYGARAIVYDDHLLYIGTKQKGSEGVGPGELFVRRPGNTTWESHDLPHELSVTGTPVGYKGVMLGLVNNNKRVLACGGVQQDSPDETSVTDACYYLERDGTSLRLGKAPTMVERPRRNACYAFDGNSMVLAGG